MNSRTIELSQNIDRFTDATPWAITNCLTPTGQPYITTRGGPLIGLEALALQGLPIDNLLLTRESVNQQQDLAGNAMTSTVVGPAILGALIVGCEALPKGLALNLAQKTCLPRKLVDQDDYSNLHELPLDLAKYSNIEVATFLAEAQKSRRLCYCEGQVLVTSRQLRRCSECLHTTCEKCGGTPSHVYEALGTDKNNPRLLPQDFEKRVKTALPMRLTVQGLSRRRMEELRGASSSPVHDETWEQYISAILPALGEELRFQSLRRAHVWTIHYDGPCSRLELLLYPQTAEWRLYAKVSKHEPGDSKTRQLLAYPFARMRPHTSGLFDGQWQFCLPTTTQLSLSIEGRGNLVRSWESRIGLQGPKFAEKHVWTELRVKVGKEGKDRLDLDISGHYKWLPDCGTASSSLHKKISGIGAVPIYFFLDPDRVGNPVADQFVFSTEIHRLTYGEVRSTIARANSSWRPSAHEGPQDVTCSVYGHWIDCNTVELQSFAGRGATFAVPPKTPQVPVAPSKRGIHSSSQTSEKKCAAAVLTLLHCNVPLSGGEDVGWKKGNWVEVNQTNERALFTSFAWLTEKTRDLDGFSDHWRHLQVPAEFQQCQECAPDRPLIAWRLVENAKSSKIVPYEDPRQAGAYERAIKARPAPFVTHVRINDNNVGQLSIGLNICTLIHRAVANLQDDDLHGKVHVSWRLDTNFIWQPRTAFPAFTLLGNRSDEQAAQPPNWKGGLRPEQLRSLSWMLRQEAQEAKPFVEEEVEEAVLSQMGWRAEGRATRSRKIRGGFLADAPGYGKTAITLALIETQRSKASCTPGPPGNGMIPVKATLILVPSHLVRQWKREIEKFLKLECVVVSIQDQRRLGGCTINDFRNADIIIAAWSIFESPTYLQRLGQFAAVPEAPANGGRAFQAWNKRALDRSAKHLDVLISDGARRLADLLETELATAEEDEEFVKFVPSKRLRGTAYIKAKECKTAAPESEMEVVPDPKIKLGNRDPFGLRSRATKTDWNDIKCPLFELFQFNRLVVDEFTFIKGTDFTSIANLKAKSRWILSGSAPLEDFHDAKTVASLLGINLGIDDDATGVIKGRNIQTIRKDRTSKSCLRRILEQY